MELTAVIKAHPEYLGERHKGETTLPILVKLIDARKDVINKYAVMAHEVSDKVPEKVRCHMLRHSKAVHLLQAGVNLIYIRDFLGHSDIKTTEIYARADAELKRKALENAYPDLVDSNLPDWSENSDLMEWLSDL